MKDIFIAGVKEKYPKEVLEGRLTVEGNVIACCYIDPLLIDECDFKSTDFITSDGTFYYSLAKQLRKQGYTVFDEVTILSSVSENIVEAFQERGGFETIKNMTDVVNVKNAEIYLDNLYRENIILGMCNDGFNLLTPVDWNGKEVIPLKLFRKMDSESVLDWYESKLSAYKTGQSSVVLEEEVLDFDDEFIQSCADGEENGVPFDICGKDVNGEDINGFPFLSRQINGLLEGTFSMMGGFSSAGKSTWLITLIMGLLYRDRKIIIISNEERIKKFKIKFMVWLLAKRNRYYQLTKKKMTSGDISDEDMEQLKYVQKYWRDTYKSRVRLVSISEANVNVAKKKIREAVLNEGFDTFVYDTFKIQEKDFNNARQDLALVKDSRDFDKLCKKYNIIGIATVQLAESLKGKLFLDSSVLSNSKQIKEVLENLFLMRTVYDEELDPQNKLYCKPFRLKKGSDGKWVEEEYIPDRTAVWRMFFVEKTRDGNNSSDTGVAYLLRYSGDFAVFRETCQCRPKHGRIE